MLLSLTVISRPSCAKACGPVEAIGMRTVSSTRSGDSIWWTTPAISCNRCDRNRHRSKQLPTRPSQDRKGTIMSKTELFEKGLQVRKEVLGEDYVNKSIAGADEFTRAMAEWSTEFCWGALWTRPGVDRRTRSIVNLAMLGALNRPHELKLHVKGALKNGLTKDEIKEILLQVAVYCGIPSGIDAFRNAREAFNEVDAAS